MGVYIVFFTILFIGSFINDPNNAVRYSVFSIICFWLIIGLRDLSIGSDTLGYAEEFFSLTGESFGTMFRETQKTGEYLFYIISWMIAHLSNNVTTFFLIWALFPAISLYVTFKREINNGQDHFVAFLCLFLLGFYAFFVAGIRQTAALSLTLLSYKFIKERRIIKFIIIVFIASLIHRSAILFLVAYPLSYLKVKWWYVFFIVVFASISSLFSSAYIFVISKYFFADSYSNYTMVNSSQNASAFIIQSVLFFICCIQAKSLTKRDGSNNILLVFSLVGLFIQSMAGMLAEVSRVSFYFCIFNIILVSRAIREFDVLSKNKFPFYIFVTLCIIYLFVLTGSNLPDYKFIF